MKNRKNVWVALCCCLLAVMLLASCGGAAATTDGGEKESTPESNSPSASDGAECVHEAEIDEAIEATCTEGGLSQGSHCAKCDEILTFQEEVPALGHSFENGACTVCKQKEPSAGLSFRVNNNELALIGIGSCKDTLIVIPESENGKTVTFIQNGALAGCESIEGVIVPAGVTGVGDEAFKGCTKLESVVLPEGVTFLGAKAFEGCTALTDIWCAAKAQTDTWPADWPAGTTATVHWGDSWEYVDGVPTVK